MSNIIWRATSQQEKALASIAYETLFGGARGGGKTDAGIAWLLYDVEHPKFKALVIRKNAIDLSDWIERAKAMFIQFGAKATGSPVVFTFPSGAVIKTGHLNDENAFEKYQGHEYHRMLIEELTHIPSERHYIKLISSCRSSVPELKPQIFATTNPGGPGHTWVKKRFIDKGNAEEVFTADDTGRTRLYVPATIDDNPYLKEADPDYVKYLDNLPDGLRDQWRYGSWEDMEIEGAYYTKRLRKEQITKVPIETSLPVITAWDLGIGDSTAIWFIQVFGREFRIVHYYENNNEGLPHYINYLHDLRAKYGFVYGDHIGPHDLAVRELTTGKSRIETAKSLGINFKIAPNLSIEDGIEAVRNILPACWFDKDEAEKGIECLKNYRKEFDDKKQVWKSNPLHDWSSHGADAFRMFAVTYKEKGPAIKLNLSNQVGWMG